MLQWIDLNNFGMHVTDSPSSLIRKQNFSTSRAELEAINTEKCRKWSFESLDSDSSNFWLFKKSSNQQLKYYQHIHETLPTVLNFSRQESQW